MPVKDSPKLKLPDFSGPPLDDDTYHRLLKDLLTLEAASKHLRAIGWFGVAIFGFFVTALALFGFFLLVMGGVILLPFFLFTGFLFLGGLALYFRLANSVARGSRLGIGSALTLITLLTGIFALRILQHPTDVGAMIFETFWLLAHLNLIKLLCQSWSAAGRLNQLMTERRILASRGS